MNDVAKPSRKDLSETLRDPQMAQVFGQLVPRHMTPERMLRLSIACITRTPKLLEVPQVQVLGALVQCAGLGLEPNSPLQHAHLIPFRNNKTNRYDLQMIIGYRGYVELGRRTGKQRWVHADVVRPGDEFEYTYGNDAHLRHRPGRGAQERQTPTDAYCFVQLEDGFAFVVLPEWEILRHREHSFAWKQEKERSPWGQHPDRMWRKTAIRVLYSGGEVPLDTELAMAVATDDQRMDWRSMGEMAMKGGKSAIEHLKEGMDTFVTEQEEEPEESDAAEPELRSQVRRAAPEEFVMPAMNQAELEQARSALKTHDIPQTAPGRTRRTNDQIKADLIQDIRNAQSVQDIEALLDSKEYTNRSPEMKADIDAEAEAMITALREADVPEDFDRGEPREEVVPHPEHRPTDKTEAGATGTAPAYKLLGLTGTLIQMLPAEEWFDELWDKIEETSPGMREKLLTVNQGVIQKLLNDHPELSVRVQALVAKVNEE